MHCLIGSISQFYRFCIGKKQKQNKEKKKQQNKIYKTDRIQIYVDVKYSIISSYADKGTSFSNINPRHEVWISEGKYVIGFCEKFFVTLWVKFWESNTLVQIPLKIMKVFPTFDYSLGLLFILDP